MRIHIIHVMLSEREGALKVQILSYETTIIRTFPLVIDINNCLETTVIAQL